MRAPPPRWVTRGTTQGLLYSYIERPMPWIEREYLECSVYLYPSEAAAENGANFGGSGFLLSVPLTEASLTSRVRYHLAFVVTNRHVTDHGSMVVRINTTDGKMTTIPLDGAKWYPHPTSDLTICPIGLDDGHQFSSVPLE